MIRLLTTVLFLASLHAVAEVTLTPLNNNTPADADDVMGNLNALKAAIDAIQEGESGGVSLETLNGELVGKLVGGNPYTGIWYLVLSPQGYIGPVNRLGVPPNGRTTMLNNNFLRYISDDCSGQAYIRAESVTLMNELVYVGSPDSQNANTYGYIPGSEPQTLELRSERTAPDYGSCRVYSVTQEVLPWNQNDPVITGFPLAPGPYQLVQ